MNICLQNNNKCVRMFLVSEKIKFGHELQIGKMDVQFYYETKSNSSILITPIIVRFQL